MISDDLISGTHYQEQAFERVPQTQRVSFLVGSRGWAGNIGVNLSF